MALRNLDGGPVRVVIVGPSQAGKTTAAAILADAMRQIDSTRPPIVIDFDRIAEALGSGHHHEHPAPHRWVALAAWKAAVRSLPSTPNTVPVILIHAHPHGWFDADYYAGHGWQIIDLTNGGALPIIDNIAKSTDT